MREPDPDEVAAIAALIAGAERPAFIVGSDVYWDGAWDELRAAVEHLRVPCFFNGLGRGTLPASHELSFLRTRGLLKERADVVVVLGTPLDFRLGFGRFGNAQVAHVVDSDGQRAQHVDVPTAAGDIRVDAARCSPTTRATRRDHEGWIGELRAAEDRAAARRRTSCSPPTRRRSSRAASTASSASASPTTPSSSATAATSRRTPASSSRSSSPAAGSTPARTAASATAWATRSRRESRGRRARSCVLLGDGAAGFSLMDADSLVRHGLPVVIVVGNNGMWGLEKHPMQAIYGWDVACDLQPECRYDEVVRALGGAGELVRDPGEIGPALDRGFASGVPYLVNVVTDPTDVYPRTSQPRLRPDFSARAGCCVSAPNDRSAVRSHGALTRTWRGSARRRPRRG